MARRAVLRFLTGRFGAAAGGEQPPSTQTTRKEIIMLKDSAVMAVLPAKDINRARDFYRDKLGLESSEAMEEYSLLYRCGNGTSFLIYQTDSAGTAKNTQMGWDSDNIERDMEELRARGVKFEEYDMPGLKTENGLATGDWGKAAWFLDSEGNILNLSQRT
jgi:catechol 2,3-dioxygenase-like lactoylglutathione lyase family enzyme